VNVDPDVVIVRYERIACVEAHTDPDLHAWPRVREEGALTLLRGGDRLSCISKSQKEAVSLRIDLNTAMRSKCLS
jgi:hypothetical protein